MPTSSANCFILALCLCASYAFKDVVFIHGILAGPEEFDYFSELIQQHHPGTRVHAIHADDNISSIKALWEQVTAFNKVAEPILTNSSSEGTVLISFSQGGIISRGILSVLKHNVETFISLSGPLAGQFGDKAILKDVFPALFRDSAYLFFYTDEGQMTSVGNYWNDPHHQDLYRNYSRYLAVLNNETTKANPRSQEFKSNFLRLKNLVLVGGPDDGVIEPWQSSHFGVYNESLVALPMTEQKWYHNDAFGLRTLDKEGRIHVHTQPNITHTHWHKEKIIFDKYIKPWL